MIMRNYEFGAPDHCRDIAAERAGSTAIHWRWQSVLLIGLLAFAALGCSELATEADRAPAGFDVPISVHAVHPAVGGQGQTVEVRILGEGFVNGAVPTWERGGVADTLISVGQVVFVSDSELLATVAIGLAADPAEYDVVVSRTRKGGIGTEEGSAGEIFRVVEFTNGHEIVVIGSLFPNTVNKTRAWGINDRGTVAGFSLPRWDVGNGPRAFGWDPNEGIYELLGTTGFEYGIFDSSEAFGINNHGDVIGVITEYTGDGSYSSGPPPYTRQGFVMKAGSLVLLPSSDGSRPAAINDAGTVVGAGGFGDNGEIGDPRILVWQRGADGSYADPIDLGPWHPGFVPDFMGAVSIGINARGDVITNGPQGTPILWHVQTDGSYGEGIELGVPAGERAHAMGINDQGWIVGASESTTATFFGGGDFTALLWNPADYSRPISLGAGVARAINNDYRVVGSYADGGGAVLWTVNESGERTSTVRLRGPSGFDFSSAHDINADGWIAGYSTRTDDGDFESVGAIESIATLWRPGIGH
jgi:uncharacterized membrane protein